MTTPMCEDGGLLREWAPLTKLLQQIPLKAQYRLFTQDVNFTCIDVVKEFIAVGTNQGLVYWYGREKGDLQRLRCENTNANITCVRVISTVDYMVATGNDLGIVTVFQIPKNPPDSLPESLKPKQKKQVERYTIGGLHKKSVTTVEWSKNGMKLFSGDQDGLVVLTEIDFYMHLSKSSELLNEKYPVVQLSYQQGLLLVSTIFRTILVNRNQNDRVSQVGQKERKTLGKLGATFGPRQNYVQEPVIYCSRPGLRLWQADETGTVLKTLIFKDALQNGYTEVELLNPVPETAKKNRNEPTLGVVLPFCEDLLVTYSDDMVYVINPTDIGITSAVTDLRRVTDVACNKDEIFILEGDRNIIRIAYYPETGIFHSVPGPETTTDPLASLAEISKPVTAGIMELTSKLKESAIVPAIPFHKINPSSLIQSMSIVPTVTIGTDTTTIINAEEAIEVPPVVPLELSTHLQTDVIEDNVETLCPIEERRKAARDERRDIFQKISEQAFEDVVFTPERKTKRSTIVLHNGNDHESFDGERMVTSCPNGLSEATSNGTTPSFFSTTMPNGDENRKAEHVNLETIRKDVEDKEKLLANILNFDLSEYMTTSRVFSSDAPIVDTSETLTPISGSHNFDERSHDSDVEQNENSITESLDDEDESYRTELKKLQELGECSKALLRRKLEEPDDNVGNRNDTVRTTRSDMMDGRGFCNYDLEMQFNVLSKEFVTPAIMQDEDWVLL